MTDKESICGVVKSINSSTLDTNGNVDVMNIKKYEVVFVDEYNNWYLVGFYDTLKEAEKDVNEYLKTYVDEETNEPLYFGKNSTCGELTEYASTFNYCFDRILDTPEGCIQVRGFIFD